MTISTLPRPYVLTFRSGLSYPVSSEEAQRLIDNYPALKATRNRVVLRGDGREQATIRPATRGGGPAFTLTQPIQP